MLKLDFFQKIIEKLYNFKQDSNSKLVINYKNPSELSEIFNLDINNEGSSINQMEDFIDNYLEYSTNTNSNQFFNQFYTGGNLPAIIGEIISIFTNTSMYTFEVAPVATLIEKKLIEKMSKLAGFQNGDGIFLTGGSNANLVAMLSARNRCNADAKLKGLQNSSVLTAFVSDQMHYSFQIAANILGIGIDNLIKVKSDDNGCIIVEELEKSILDSKKRGEIPFFVAAIAGTTVLGAFDDFVEINEVAKKYNLWFHIDGALGASFLLSDQKDNYFKGSGLADSMTWDAHKLMNIPFVCSVILTKEKNILNSNISNLNKEYLYHQPDSNDFDLGVKSLQCGRSVDALKLWVAWKFYGDQGYKNHLNKLLEICKYFTSKVKENSALELYANPQSICVCFRIKTEKDIDQYNLMLREKLVKIGKSLVNYTYINGSVYFRFVNVNFATTEEHIDVFFENLFESIELLK